MLWRPAQQAQSNRRPETGKCFSKTVTICSTASWLGSAVSLRQCARTSALRCRGSGSGCSSRSSSGRWRLSSWRSRTGLAKRPRLPSARGSSRTRSLRACTGQCSRPWPPYLRQSSSLSAGHERALAELCDSPRVRPADGDALGMALSSFRSPVARCLLCRSNVKQDAFLSTRGGARHRRRGSRGTRRRRASAVTRGWSRSAVIHADSLRRDAC